MFRLWKLVLLCGLLTGTSASLLGDLGNDLNILDKLKPLFDKGLETVENQIEKLKAKIEALPDSTVWQEVEKKYQEAEKLLNNAISDLIPSTKPLGLKIGGSRVVNFQPELTPDGKGLKLRFPITANVTLALPIIGNVINLQASLDLLTEVNIETNNKTGLPLVVLGECTSDPASIQLTILDRESTFINRIVDTLSNFLDKTVSFLVQKEVSLPLLGTQSQAWLGEAVDRLLVT
ncbi:BPI fold-containing family A member 2 [Orycteropus afer afer]|uniref:BPI fold-containing family A member 2 n=1 Tax=Orycteropus afer afer TaxID=1230840 RepID=A0A8B6ZBA0_ORYAF|nr:BPI fold-containing family A member 2 [Orycteropus afer afer]